MASRLDSLNLYFQFLFGKLEGFISIAYKDARTGKFIETFWKYPDQRIIIEEYVGSKIDKGDCYFSAQLFNKQRRVKENVITCMSIWADLDECNPDLLLIPPTIYTQTSKGRYQGFWVLKEPIKAVEAERIAKNIAYYHQKDGADISGWDLTQLVRIPWTNNFKYPEQGNPQINVYGDWNSEYSAIDFNIYPSTDDPETYSIKSMPTNDTSMYDILASKPLTPKVLKTFYEEPESDWSGALYFLINSLYEIGCSEDEVFVIVKDSACNKFKRDGRPDRDLWLDVLRCKPDNTGVIVSNKLAIITGSEKEQVEAFNNTFVEDYITWASYRTDAAKQYHEVCAFIVLSSLMSDAVFLPTDQTKITLNLWALILGDTTLTRKTTAIKYAISMLRRTDENLFLATDGTYEGIVSELQKSEGRSKIFYRDEFSGWLASTKKQYQSGLLEDMTKLYDNDSIKRVLSNKTIQVDNPIVNFLCGGAKARTLEALSHEHILSGFLPRFMIVQADTPDKSKRKRLGPPKRLSGKRQGALESKCKALRHFYGSTIVATEGKAVVEKKKIFKADLTPEAWDKNGDIADMMIDFGLVQEHKESMVPMMDRLATSGLKMATLLAALRMEDKVIVGIKDILHAFYYIDKWSDHTVAIVTNIGLTLSEKTINKALSIIRQEDGAVIKYAILSRKLKVGKKTLDELLDTLESRSLIKTTPNKGERGAQSVIKAL